MRIPGKKIRKNPKHDLQKWVWAKLGQFGRMDVGPIPTRLANKFSTYPSDERIWEQNPHGGRYTHEEWKNFLDDVRKNGIQTPIDIWRTMVAYRVNNGNHRRKAARALGIRKVPAMMSTRRPGAIYHPRLAPFGPVFPMVRKAKKK